MPLNDKSKKYIAAVLLLVLALLSVTVFSRHASAPETHRASLAVLEEKKVTAMELTAAVAITSTAISALPGDAATPIATQLSELTTPLLAVVCAIYLEKFLLTTTGYLSFAFLVPAACLLLGIRLFYPKDVLKTLGLKLLVFSVAIVCVIPVSMKVTALIETTFEESIEQTFHAVDAISEEAESAAEEEDSNAFSEFLMGIGNELNSLAENAKNALSLFVDAIAVLIITTCVIPLAVLFFFVWLIKLLFGVNLDVSAAKKLIPTK